jgi:hypothetical protein
MKRCSKCLEVLPISEFNYPEVRNDCKACETTINGGPSLRGLTKELRKVLARNSEYSLVTIVEEVVRMAEEGDKEMIKFIWDRIEGKVKDNVAIEHSGQVTNTNLSINVVATADELRSKIRGQLQAPAIAPTLLSTSNQSTDNGPTSTH